MWYVSEHEIRVISAQDKIYFDIYVPKSVELCKNVISYSMFVYHYDTEMYMGIWYIIFR